MQTPIHTLDAASVGSIELPDHIFGLEPRQDLVQRMVRYQLSKRQRGTHKTKTRGEIQATSKKMYKQKGTGGARHGNKAAPQFRGGGKAFGPIVRSHAHDLPKKVRALALKHALSAKMKAAQIIVLEKAETTEPKTAKLREQFIKLGLESALIIGGAELDKNFALAARNIPEIDVLPVQGLNVYDIMRRKKLVLTRAALEAISARFGDQADGAAISAGAAS
jgi:large subunit ribosomal protein L4